MLNVSVFVVFVLLICIEWLIIRFIVILGLILLGFLFMFVIVLWSEVKLIIVGILVKFCKIIWDGLNGILIFWIFFVFYFVKFVICFFVIICLFIWWSIDLSKIFMEYGNWDMLLIFVFLSVFKL